MPNPCYSGSNPIGKLTEEERLGLWKWVTENAIQLHSPGDPVGAAMPMEQLHEAFNNHFFGGSLTGEKAAWINEFLAARKTPFRRASDAAWAAQANRRAIQQQAKHLVNNRNATNLERAFNAVIAAPRYTTVGGGTHFAVFPFSHGGALLLNPLRWKAFARMVRNTWRNLSPAEAEILRDTMARSPRFTLAKRSQLDLSTHGNETGGGNLSTRGWAAMVETRFRLWDAAMERHINSGKFSADDIDSIGKELAVWANHATGSGKGLLTSNKYISSAFFGPKLAQSYWNRMVADPLKTIATFSSWNRATSGEKVVAMQRLRGSVTAALTYTGMLLANQALLAATGQKDQINWNDPSQSDWLGFKGGGFRWGLPGAMRTEINLIGQIIAAQSMKSEDLAAVGILGPKNADTSRLLSMRELYVARQLWSYVQNKATPAYGLGKELLTGHDFRERPLPWSSDKGDPKHPPISWGEFGASKLPIPLSAAAGYVYDQLRKSGSSVKEASMWMRAAMVGGVSFAMGIDPKEVKDNAPHRTREQARVGR
jgi:hypothetical protein